MRRQRKSSDCSCCSHACEKLIVMLLLGCAPRESSFKHCYAAPGRFMADGQAWPAQTKHAILSA